MNTIGPPGVASRRLGGPAPGGPATGAPTSRARLAADRLVRWAVMGGGVAIVACILGVGGFIAAEVVPLLAPAKVEPAREIPLGAAEPAAAVTDEHRTHLAALGLDGVLRVYRLPRGELALERRLFPEAETPLAGGAVLAGGRLVSGATRQGRVTIVEIGWKVQSDGARRAVEPEVGRTASVQLDTGGAPLRCFAAAASEDLRLATVAAALEPGRLRLVRLETVESPLTGEATTTDSRQEIEAPPGIERLLLDREQRNLYGTTDRGRLLWWRIEPGGTALATEADVGDVPVTALCLLFGDQALVVGGSDGSVDVWFPLRGEGDVRRLARVRSFPSHPGPVRLIAASSRDKSFLVQDAGGTLGLYHSTSNRTLWRGRSPVREATALLLAPKNDAAFVLGRGRAASLEVRNLHPEVSLRTLFGPVWYEGHEEPTFVWQSTGGTDEFEPKLSLTPLLFGTLKGTAYALLVAIPLGVLAAIYASEFMDPRLKRWIKPTVEIMAALPSVVLGFVAGLWLAPRLEQAVPALAIVVAAVPGFVLAARFLWSRLPPRPRGAVPGGFEIVLYAAAAAAAVAAAVLVAEPLEAWLFGGDFPAWLSETMGIRYDQRNALVVGIAMGFAVIPIIFAIAEDAISNVPRDLVSGALALGASRWQAVRRVVLPTASAGIFAAVMVGFGRAVGETMIVLMATGNTPILSPSPFDGFRTLSANIAVEIPEAPYGGTLYRTLFASALLLFAVTFLVNTAADAVRERLRRRYARL